MTSQVKLTQNINCSLVKLLDKWLETKLEKILDLLEENFNKKWGYNYELKSRFSQYYSNVHSTVSFCLYFSGLLTTERQRILAEIIVRLRDSNHKNLIHKTDVDSPAWDTIEGPNVFSTALSCYALLHLAPNVDIRDSIKWLVDQRSEGEIWGYRKGISGNYVITLYTLFALQKFRETNKIDHDIAQAITKSISDTIRFIKAHLSLETNKAFWKEYDSVEISISNTIAALYILSMFDPVEFRKKFPKAKLTIDKEIENNPRWFVSLLSKVETPGYRKIMYTYNPAYLPLLLKMGYLTDDPIVVKMVNWLIADLKNFWTRSDNAYPWRSSDSVIQSFIAAFAVFSLIKWYNHYMGATNKVLKRYSGNTRRDIFLCHATKDKSRYVHKLKDALQESGLSVWYDEGEILWGDNTMEKVNEGVRSSRLAIICFSKNLLNRAWAISEFAAFFERQIQEKKKTVLPLILNSEAEVFEKLPILRNLQYRKWSAKNLPQLIREVNLIIERTF